MSAKGILKFDNAEKFFTRKPEQARRPFKGGVRDAVFKTGFFGIKISSVSSGIAWGSGRGRRRRWRSTNEMHVVWE
eukprot:10397147-Lingulodinium_polyedra.AAC.1